MTQTPTFSSPMEFLGARRCDPGAQFCVAGIPLDLGTTNRSGAREGPHAIRRASRMLVDGAHPSLWIDPAELDLADIGDFAVALGDLPQTLALIDEQASKIEHLLALGGEHGLTLPLLRAIARRRGPQALVHFDAHPDTWPENFGQRFSHGSVFYNAICENLLDPKRVVQIGIRSPIQRSVWEWTVERGVTIITAHEVHDKGPAWVAERVRGVVAGHSVYLSFDIDALDPAFAPGTGTPEIGGLASWQAQAILRQLRGLDWCGMDVVEVAPAYDSAEITALAAATIVWEYLALVGDIR